jgi:matrixin
MDLKRHFRVRGQVGLAAGLALAAALGSLVILAYNPEQDDVNNAAVATRWPNNSMTWSLNPTLTGSKVAPGSNVQTALTNAFATWKSAALSGQGVVSLAITQGSNSTLTTVNASDCINVVSFVDSTSSDFSTGTIAFAAVATDYGPPPTTYSCTSGGKTTTQTCGLPSCIIDADIMFNPTQPFSTATPTPKGDFDVQSVATHEIGHALGLDHSGIAAAVMYPFGDVGAGPRTLAVDDSAGIAFLYPAAAFSTATGTISGQVIMNGKGIFASHVIAIDTATGDAVLDGLTDTSGNYKLIGLPASTSGTPYYILALPLAPNSNSGIYTLSDFGGWSCGYAGTTENSPPCCDPATVGCRGTPESNPTNYTGKFF